jgi:aryl-alcohol dehydrogenase-like predicted oxidoreductase
MKTTNLGNSGQTVSQMALGTMYFGSKIEENTANTILETYMAAGGSFLDTANNYAFWLDGCTGNESESFLGRWMEQRDIRKDIFLATKVGVRPVGKDPSGNHIFEGLSGSAIREAVENSLSRLRTDYIDLYYIHVDWRSEPLEETLETLNSLVSSGKVRYLGCSNTATWRIVEAKNICRKNSWAEFQIAQNWFTYLRPREGADMWVHQFSGDELFDYCRTTGDLSMAAYSSTLSGLYKWNTIYDRQLEGLSDRFHSLDNEKRLAAVKEVAKTRQISPFQVVFAWMMQQDPPVIPIMGVSSIDQLQDNLKALDLTLTPADMQILADATRSYKSE